ncbi:Taperin, partial [Ophiophagus hannah]
MTTICTDIARLKNSCHCRNLPLSRRKLLPARHVRPRPLPAREQPSLFLFAFPALGPPVAAAWRKPRLLDSPRHFRPLSPAVPIWRRPVAPHSSPPPSRRSRSPRWRCCLPARPER